MALRRPYPPSLPITRAQDGIWQPEQSQRGEGIPKVGRKLISGEDFLQEEAFEVGPVAPHGVDRHGEVGYGIWDAGKVHMPQTRKIPPFGWKGGLDIKEFKLGECEFLRGAHGHPGEGQ